MKHTIEKLEKKDLNSVITKKDIVGYDGIHFNTPLISIQYSNGLYKLTMPPPSFKERIFTNLKDLRDCLKDHCI